MLELPVPSPAVVPYYTFQIHDPAFHGLENPEEAKAGGGEKECPFRCSFLLPIYHLDPITRLLQIFGSHAIRN